MKRFFFLALLLSGLIITGCGTSIDSPTGEIIAPPNSKIVINPSKVEIKDGTPLAVRHYQTFTVSVLTPNNQPIGYVKLHISFLWACPDEYCLVQLYDGACSNTNPPTNPPKNSPFEAVTDKYGAYNLCFGFLSGGGLEYSAPLEVSSGSVYNSADFSVKAD